MTQNDGTGNILIVDDTPDNIDLLGGLLKRYKRTFALNGEKALEKVEKNPPDLILLDVMMPGLDGFEVCRRLKANPQTNEIPVIFITAMGQSEDETRGFEVGAVDYITKPFSPAVVKARVQTHLALTRAKKRLANQNEILEHRVSERTAQLREAFGKLKEASLDTIYRLTRAAEYRDDDTGAHVLRMSNYSAAIARALGLNEEVVEGILHAAPMHDIGKIGIPDRILLKPGRLDEDEWKIMRRHCKFGANILEGSETDVIRLGATVALTHHEKWNGSGYPRGLKGEEIPVEGRIVAVADVYDALTSERPYKKAFSHEKATSILREERGRHFQEKVVDAFFEVESEILSIRKSYQETAPTQLASLSKD
jgi:putative two-component system response regulator